MKKPTLSRQEGNLVILSLGLLLGVAALAGITLNVTSNSSRLVQRSNNVARAEAAAEGALEYAYAVWLKKIAGEPVSIAKLKEGSAIPDTISFDYTEKDNSTSTVLASLEVVALDEFGQVADNNSKPPPVTGRVPGYEGWAGNTYTYAARARVQIDEKTSIGVQRLFQYTEVPLFQSMFFYDTNLVLWSPADIVLNGLIHTNSGLYMAGSKETSIIIQSNATYVDKYDDKKGPEGEALPKLDNPKGPTWALSKNTQLHKVPPIQPMGGDPERVFNTSNNNPNDDGFREIIERRDANLKHEDPEAISKRRMVNKAGIVISVHTTIVANKETTSVTVTPQRDTTLTPAAITSIQGAFTKVIGKSKGNNPTRQGLFDRREGKNVDVVNIDMGKIQAALDSSGVKGVHSNVIYIEDTTPSTTANKSPKTLRLQNGRTLPKDGLTIASPNPVYIQGDYNTGGTGSSSVPTNGNSDPGPTTRPTAANYERRPAAVIADSVMFLSNSWDDLKSESAINDRKASNTTYNTAILAGIKPSTKQIYSGGANNFPRFLEAWSGVRCTYFGSMVQLYDSEAFTGSWELGTNYTAPNRYWSFDTKFLQRPPPGSVEAIVLSRGPWSRF